MSTQNTWLMVGAAVAGIVTAVGVVVSEYYRQEKKRHVLTQDLARLDRQMSVMRRELEQLRVLQKEKYVFKSFCFFICVFFTAQMYLFGHIEHF